MSNFDPFAKPGNSITALSAHAPLAPLATPLNTPREFGIGPTRPAPYTRAPDADRLIDVDLIRDLVRFALHACGRRKGTVALVVMAFIAAGVLGLLVLPKKFYTETKLLADRNVVMPLLGNPSRRLPNEADTPTRLAKETILDHANLEAITRSINLVEESERTKSVASRARAQLQRVIFGPLTDQERLENTIAQLRKMLNVDVTDGTVTIGVVWSDPTLAYRIVQQAQQNFLAERQTQELSLITGSIAILEKSAAGVQGDIKSSLDSLQKERVALTPDDQRLLREPVRRAPPSPELLAAQAKLETVQRNIADLEQSRSKRLSDLQATLAEERNTYGAAHPQIENTQQLITSMMTDSPQLISLRRDEQDLKAQVMKLGGTPSATTSIGEDRLLTAAAIRSIEGLRSDSLIQEKQQYGRSRLRIAIDSYQELLQRLDAARMELQTVRATFQYKYGVLIPAAVPREPLGVSPALVLVGAIILGVGFALFAAVALDLASGRVLESWQIERSLGLPVLGETPVA